MKKKSLLIGLFFIIILASNSAFADNLEAFMASMKTCQPYTGTFQSEFFGQKIQVTKKIYGMKNNSCFYTEMMDGKGFECHLPVNLLVPYANYVRASSKGTDFSTQISADGSSKSYIDGKPVDNVLQYAFDKGYCKSN